MALQLKKKIMKKQTKKTLPQSGIEPGTFSIKVYHSNHYSISSVKESFKQTCDFTGASIAS